MVGAVNSGEFPADGIQRFGEAMDALAEQMCSLGFPQTLYTHIDTPRQPDGKFNPLPLTIRNFPKNWDRLWHRYCRMDPYYHACFNTSYVVDWQKVRAESKLCPVQQEACHYLEDIGMNQGITVPIHHHGGGFTAVSAICSTSEADWPVLFRQVSELVFVTAHRFQNKYYGLYTSEHGEIQGGLLSARESEVIRWVAYGKTVPEIATILKRSPETIKYHVKNAYNKLGARNRGHAISQAAKLGLL
jgi:DNA-binding CsgD family transcriptional regulator